MLSLIYFSENFRVSKNFLKSGESWDEFGVATLQVWPRW
jgi:hypothetical protein